MFAIVGKGKDAAKKVLVERTGTEILADMRVSLTNELTRTSYTSGRQET
jgi:hypothetical protein